MHELLKLVLLALTVYSNYQYSLDLARAKEC
jgi:hypothetical protein